MADLPAPLLSYMRQRNDRTSAAACCVCLELTYCKCASKGVEEDIPGRCGWAPDSSILDCPSSFLDMAVGTTSRGASGSSVGVHRMLGASGCEDLTRGAVLDYREWGSPVASPRVKALRDLAVNRGRAATRERPHQPNWGAPEVSVPSVQDVIPNTVA